MLEDSKVDSGIVRAVEKALKDQEKIIKDHEKAREDAKVTIDELGSKLKKDRVQSTINEIIAKNKFDTRYIDGIEAILRNKISINDDFSVLVDKKEPEAFAKEWLNGAGKNYLAVEPNVGGGANNTNKQPDKNVQPNIKISDYDAILQLINHKG